MRMPKNHHGQLKADAGAKWALVASRFNEFVTSHLVSGATDALVRHGAADENVHVFWVPGSFEIPSVARRLARSGEYAAVVCLGAIIRGGTPHFEYIAAEASKGVAQVAFGAPVPVIFGVLTTDTIEQAIERAGTKAGNKGADAAVTAVEMASLYAQLPQAE
jgi:6,7-dimethyl-8-ribityllumazine synthase